MRKKIIGIFIMMLLIVTAIPTLGIVYNNEKYNTSFFIDKDNEQNIKLCKLEVTQTGLLDQLDQSQETHDNDYLIGSDVIGYRLAQSFKPSLSTLTSFSLYLSSTFSIIGWHYFNYRISIRKNSLTSADILHAIVPTSQLIQGTSFWLTIYPSSPIAVTPGDTYYIVIYGLEPGTMGDANLFWYYKSGGNAYLNGDGYVMDQPDPTWWPIFGGGDFCFRTYGESGSTNDPPNTPVKPSGSITGSVGVAYSYETSTNDPDGDDVKYGWDWSSDDLIDEWSGLQASGTTCTMSHTWTNPGTYNLKVKAQDENGALSGWSSALTVVITAGNNPPNKPNTPSGATSGKTGTLYTYSTSTTDPENDNVYYLFDWGDGTNSGWFGPHDSGIIISLSHTWTADGTYPLKVKAKDINDEESPWSDPFSVTMPKNKAINIPLFLQRFFQRFPMFEKILNQII